MTGLYTIAPHAPFLATLADRILDGTLLGDWPRQGPFWVADITVILPTQRARLALGEAFRARGHGLLPDIRTFGSENPEEEPFLPPDDGAPLPPDMPPLSRRLLLARLVDAFARAPGNRDILATPPNPAEVFWLADSLAELIDDLGIEGIAASALDDLPVGELAGNWELTLRFLKVALEHWPVLLAGEGRADAAANRNARILRRAEAASAVYGARPVIAAGSTGSVPATARLLRAIAALPRGAVVLPGLDTTLSDEAIEDLRRPDRLPHGHPQYGLVRLLDRLGVRPASVVELAPPFTTDRTPLVRIALSLPDHTADWQAAAEGLTGRATEGIAVIAARNEDEEARAIALAARDTLAAKKTVGIVTPDRTLARRIVAELARDGVSVDDSAGTPLFQAPAGRLARQLLAAAGSEFAAVDLMALLRHPATRLGMSRWDVARIANAIDLGLLRGQRPAPGITGLRAALADNLSGRTKHPAKHLRDHHAGDIASLLNALGTAVEPVCDIVKAEWTTAPELAARLIAAFDAVTAGPEPADLPGSAELRAWAAGIAAADPGPRFRPNPADSVFAALTAGTQVRSPVPAREDIVIWGELEARLQNPDRMIIAGFNEDVWPAPADPGPWLSRGMRMAVGLEPPERRQGQSAHDFAMAIGNPDVVVAFAERRGGAPSLPSRFLQRLEALAGHEATTAMRARGRVFVDLARRRDAAPGLPRPAERPSPAPPASVRPKKLSVTEIETLFRSPYDLYARHVLKLHKLSPLGEALDARERGSMIHDVFANFVEAGDGIDEAAALERMMALAQETFAGLDAIADRRDIWLRRFRRSAEMFLDYERERSDRIAVRHAERKGTWTLPTGFVLTGRADRIDVRHDGRLELIDFKTGSVPAPAAMKRFEAPQLLLEAAMAADGAFEGIDPAATAGLAYVKIGLGPRAFIETAFALPEGYALGEAVEAMSARMQRHVAAFLYSDTQPMHARLMPNPAQRFPGDYDHLARVDEWTAITGDEDEWPVG